ncbi:KTSC domain-containing protein [Rhizobium sp. CC-YZS058]|uniref:KTSC domain-containing protein n=1 Tax=Rhizobium sp. CC-YZS058 TaxID=3042153 RepID=UPI002B05AA82|nr:KTSC domain-containing protein [Rhizobium sp. CC-YZS058]MEA3535462.1 KTSC domain-containing protein [Rhizobium sp. CC-YZS058]
METFDVNSRIIKKVAFLASGGQLWIEFRNGQQRLYRNVPRKAVEALVSARSPGQHYLEHIRNHFPRTAA